LLVVKGPVQESGGDELERGEVFMVIVGMVARTPKPGILPKVELAPPVAELRGLRRVLVALPRVVAILSNAFSTY